MLDLILLVISLIMVLLSSGILSTTDSAKENALIKKKIREYVRAIKQEKHGDSFFLFDADNDTFIAQGKTDDEIKSVLRARFPKHIFLLNNEYMMVGPEFDIVKIDYKVLQNLEIK